MITKRFLGMAFLCLACAANADLTTGLIAYFPFNGKANDVSGNGHHGTSSNVTLTIDRFGRVNNAYFFNGTNAFITIPSAPDFNLNNDYTVSLWFFQEAHGIFRLIDKATAGSNDGWNLDTGQSGGLFLRWVGGVPLTWTFTTSPHTIQQWHHVAVSVSNGTGRLFIDGQANGEGTCVSNGTNTLDVFIGKAHPSSCCPEELFFNGSIDDVRIYSRSLSEQEIIDIYHYKDPELPSMTINVKVVEVTMHVEPTKKYQLEGSSDLAKWTSIGQPFVATSSQIVQEFNVTETGRYFRLLEVP